MYVGILPFYWSYLDRVPQGPFWEPLYLVDTRKTRIFNHFFVIDLSLTVVKVMEWDGTSPRDNEGLLGPVVPSRLSRRSDRVFKYVYEKGDLF